MKILFCNYEYPPLGGGGGVINALLAEELGKRHEVSVVTSMVFDMDPVEVRNGVRIIRVPVPFRKNMSAANLPSLLGFIVQGSRKAREIVEAEKPDVVNTHFALPSGPVGGVLARHAGCPHVLSVHGGDLYDPSKWTSPHRHAILRWWVGRIMDRSAFVVGNSDDTTRNAKVFYGPERNVEQIPLGIARPPALDVSRKDWDLPEDAVVLVNVCRLVGRKSVDELVGMMTDLPDNVHLVVIGDGPMKPSLMAQAEQLGVSGRVRFMGQVSEDDKFRLLKLADIFASTSQHEGFGLVFLEGMASGMPVICYDKGGQTDFLKDGETGRLVPVGQRDTFLQALQGLVTNPAECKTMAAHNLEIVEGYFIEHCARSYETLFERAIAEYK